MSISTKTALPVIFVAMLLSLSAYLIQQNVVYPAFSEIELKYARDNVDRVVSRLRSEFDSISTTVYDWSSWDDTYQFIANRNNAFIESNLGADTFWNFGTELVLFIDSSDAAAWAAYYDYESEDYDTNLIDSHIHYVLPAAVKFGERIDPETPVDDRAISGVMQVDNTPLLFSMRPILKSDGTGEPRGYVMLGDLLSKQRIEKLSEQMVLNFTVEPVTASDTSVTPGAYAIRALNREQLRASKILMVDGHPGLRVSVTLPRDITLLGEEITVYGISLFVLLSLILSGSLLVLFRWLVIRPILELKNDISRIAEGMDYSVRAHIRNEDEIGLLSREFNSLLSVIESNNSELKKLSETDPLTGLFNRLALDKKLREAWNILSRTCDPLAVMLIDIDHFKAYNDHYGHQAGDDCLKTVANILKDAAKRDSDMVARYGGEEFLIVLPGTSRTDAEHIASELQNEFALANIEHLTSDVAKFVTISIGLASRVPSRDISIAELIDAADRALYQAKEHGRNTFESE